MNRTALIFNRPEALAATAPPESRGVCRDEVRMLVSSKSGHSHARFLEIANFLEPGDLIVVNESATLPASLSAHGAIGYFTINLSTDYGHNLWLAEPRWSPSKPGPLPLSEGDTIEVSGLQAKLINPYPGIPRLWFVQFYGDVRATMEHFGKPIRYGYIKNPPGIDAYQTLFSTTPGSAEMPSAARPFTKRVIDSLEKRGIGIAHIVLHTGVSSLEVDEEIIEEQQLYPEPFWVPKNTVDAIVEAKTRGNRVIAVGTTVVRALESAWANDQIQPASGFTRLYIHPGKKIRVIDGLLTGMHDPVTSHLAMLYAIAGEKMIREGYEAALEEGYLWHEFGDTHLILR